MMCLLQNHYWLVDLHHPIYGGDELIGIIELVEDVIQYSVDTLGAGTPQSAPDVADLLSDAGLLGPDGDSIMFDQYDENSEAIKAIQDDLLEKDLNVTAATGDAAIIAKTALGRIQHIVGKLNDRLDVADREATLLDRGHVDTSAVEVFVMTNLMDALEAVEHVMEIAAIQVTEPRNNVGRQS